MIGFLGGLFGKGGSAIATPLFGHSWLSGIHCGCFTIAVDHSWNASCFRAILEAPAHRLASCLVERRCRSSRDNSGLCPHKVYWLAALVDPHCHSGVWVRPFFFDFSGRQKTRRIPSESSAEDREEFSRVRLALIAAGVGFISGLLANAGGFLLAPAYIRLLKLPIKKSFACSLAVSAVLAVPGTIIHAYLGHISWTVTGLIALGSVPCSLLGARIAIRSRSSSLTRMYGLFLTALGAFRYSIS